MTCKMRKRHDLSHAAPEMSYDAVLLDIPFRAPSWVISENRLTMPIRVMKAIAPETSVRF